MHHSKIHDSILSSRRQSHFLRPWRQADFCRFPHLCPGNRHNLRFTIIVPAKAVYKTYPHYPQDFPQPFGPLPGNFGGEPSACGKSKSSFNLLSCKIVYITEYSVIFLPAMEEILQTRKIFSPHISQKSHDAAAEGERAAPMGRTGGPGRPAGGAAGTNFRGGPRRGGKVKTNGPK